MAFTTGAGYLLIFTKQTSPRAMVAEMDRVDLARAHIRVLLCACCLVCGIVIAPGSCVSSAAAPVKE